MIHCELSVLFDYNIAQISAQPLVFMSFRYINHKQLVTQRSQVQIPEPAWICIAALLYFCQKCARFLFLAHILWLLLYCAFSLKLFLVAMETSVCAKLYFLIQESENIFCLSVIVFLGVFFPLLLVVTLFRCLSRSR